MVSLTSWARPPGARGWGLTRQAHEQIANLVWAELECGVADMELEFLQPRPQRYQRRWHARGGNTPASWAAGFAAPSRQTQRMAITRTPCRVGHTGSSSITPASTATQQPLMPPNPL